MAADQPFRHIGIVGAGSMGTMMSFGFSEYGIKVSLWDVNSSNVDEAMEMSKDPRRPVGDITGYHDIHQFAKSVQPVEIDGVKRRVFLFSITHGDPADSVLNMMKDDFREGDIVLDGGNENYRNTERRQRAMEPMGVSWIGMGVSGGYQSARHGPSMSVGGDAKVVDVVLPLLRMFAAKDARTKEPCVARLGPGGAGHYVKMVHNGIENGMLATVCEAWAIMRTGLGMSNDEVGKVFEDWNSSGVMRNTYLIQIASEICQKRKPVEGDDSSKVDGHVLDEVLDKVVQDNDNTEGTLVWTVMEAAARHVSAPSIATGHFLRVASGNRRQRLLVADKLTPPPPSKIGAAKDVKSFVKSLEKAVFASFVCEFAQGLELIARASVDEKWDINLGDCLKIWRAGCIIQEEYLSDLLMPALTSGEQIMNIKLIDEVAAALNANYEALKLIVLTATEADCYIPSISASLEYVKYEGSRMLPTSFMEAQLDFFGAHNYDRIGVPGEDPGKVKKGANHFEWRPVF